MSRRQGNAPVVTGISPKEGPPGTRVTVRGENLGNKPGDLIGLTICGCDCLLSAEWKSPNKIVARSGPGKGTGEIIVLTASGGSGTCTVQFRGYYETVGPLKESAVWVEEAPAQALGWSARALSSSAFHIEDPLGLSIEGNENKMPEDDLLELFPECNGDLSSTKFSPGRFLLENHQATSFDDLRVGLSYLRRKVDSQKEGQLSFLKGNVGSVMEQLETLENLRNTFHSQSFGPASLDKLETAIKQCIDESEMMFEGVLKGREKADKTRNALGVLTRYKYLLTLPSTMDRNMAKGEYDAIISDYSRVNNLFGKTDVKLFKKVLAEVDQKIVELKEVLKERLHTMPNSIENQKKIIRSLILLEYKGDPGWEALQEHNKYIKHKLNETTMYYITTEMNLETVSKPGKSSTKQNKMPTDPNEVLNNRCECISALLKIIGNNLPNMWNLGQSYFSGELQAKFDSSKREQFKHLVNDCLTSLCQLLRQALSLSPGQNQWAKVIWFHGPISQVLNHARSTYSSLVNMPSVQDNSFYQLLSLINDLRLLFMKMVLRNSLEQIKGLETKEEWKFEYDSKYGSITQLPKMLESVLSECAMSLKETSNSKATYEGSLFYSDNARKEVLNLVQSCFAAYVECLENLSISTEEGERSKALSQVMASSVPSRNSSSTQNVVEWEERVVGCLSNGRYSREVIVSNCCDLLTPHLTDLTQIKRSVERSLTELESHLVQAYLEAKSDPLVGTIEPSMYVGHFGWDTDLSPTDLKPYAKEIIMNIVAVHAELERGCRWVKGTILQQMVETVAEEVSRLMLCVPTMSTQGAVQAHLDIAAIQFALAPYTTKQAVAFFNEALESLPQLEASDNKLIEELLKSFKSRMYMQLSCFNSSPTENKPLSSLHK